MHTRLQLQASCSPRCAPLVRCQRAPSRVSLRCLATASIEADLSSHQPQSAIANGWDYKYPHIPCASLCAPDDTRYLKVEALFQNVLGYPRLPSRVHQFMPRISTDISTITRTVENLSKRYGQELVLYYLRRSPNMLSCDYETLVARAEHVRSMLDLRPTEVLAVLRKNPNLFIMESSVVRTRFTSLHKVMPLNHDNVRKLVVKFPLILNYQTTSIEHLMDSLRQLSYTRVQWQQDFDAMSPSLIAFYLRDARDLLLRLEYLVATGENPHIDIKTVFKVSNNLFAKKHRNFRPWLHMREQRRQQQLLRQQGQQAQQEQARALAAGLSMQMFAAMPMISIAPDGTPVLGGLPLPPAPPSFAADIQAAIAAMPSAERYQ
mmetsp:Transcript_19189/g.48792  ORF Transcript_19189/g.48792 Transcript_19189/m.48792 type:complete len:377 (-) Transcript_19189:8-1138(-)